MILNSQINFETELLQIAEEELIEITKDIKQEVEIRSPKKTGDFIKNIEISDIEVDKDEISQKVFIDTAKVPYASFVEWWVQWKVYNYHKDWIVYKTDVWARPFEETFETFEKVYWFYWQE